MTTSKPTEGMMDAVETPAQEFSRLVIEYNEGEDESSQRQEAWNLIADFALEHSDTIFRALTKSSPVEAVAVKRLIDEYRNLVATGAEYAAGELRLAPTSAFEIYIGHFRDIGRDIEAALLATAPATLSNPEAPAVPVAAVLSRLIYPVDKSINPRGWEFRELPMLEEAVRFLQEDCTSLVATPPAPTSAVVDGEVVNLLTNCAQILDVVKGEWSKDGSWSAWDQSVRDGITAALKAQAAPISAVDGEIVKAIKKQIILAMQLRDFGHNGIGGQFHTSAPKIALQEECAEKAATAIAALKSQAVPATMGGAGDLGWRDIKTAPKDGTFILARAGLWRPAVVHWATYEGVTKWGGDPECFMEEDHFIQYWVEISYEPTEWIPLEALAGNPSLPSGGEKSL